MNDDDDDDLSKGAYWGGGGGGGGGGSYKRKFMIYRPNVWQFFTAKRTKVSFYG